MNAVEKIQNDVKLAIHNAVIEAKLVDEAAMPTIMLETSRGKENGDYATNIAMQLTKLAKQPPRAIAEAIVNNVDKESAQLKKLKLHHLSFFSLLFKTIYKN